MMDSIAAVAVVFLYAPVDNLWDLVSLSPDHLAAAFIFYAALLILNDLVRTAVMVEWTRSVVVHVFIDVLTLLPAFLLGAAVLAASYRDPDRAWLNLGLAIALYAAWYAGGALTILARGDTEAADIGWMAMGALVTVPCGLIAVILF